ncbi:MAG: sulfide-dependent adenosine diphosphate thiazole synthase [Kiritimatiellae bacterium]|nr:sulfide-dependent adenosine diphosphate thiazole synthase [Kiritimatiellia bacterium]
MEAQITGAIVRRYFAKLQERLTLDVAIVGAGPSGLVAARDLARLGLKVAIFESKLAPGGGVWGGGMLFNEVAVQEDALPILESFGVAALPAGDGYYTCDAVELASGLIFGACRAGATIFNAVKVEDLMVREGRVAGLVVNWTPVARLEMHVDPLVVTARAVIDGSGHPSEAVAMATRKAGLRIDSPSGGIVGEKPMWMELGEHTTVENTKRLCPGLYASGMAANNVQGGYRMGPIFGGMLKSGRKVAGLVAQELGS